MVNAIAKRWSFGLLLVPALAGCLLDDSAKSSGGSGGASGSGVAGSAATTSSGGSAGSAPQCAADGECPDDPSICLTARCEAGACTMKPANEGTFCLAKDVCHGEGTCKAGVCYAPPEPKDTPLPNDAGNCMKTVCDGMGAPVTLPDDSDAPAEAACVTYSCSGGTVVPANKSDNTTCNGEGYVCCSGVCCPACGFC